MSNFNEEEVEFQHLMNSAPQGAVAPPELKARLRTLAGMTRPHRSFRLAPGFVMAGAAGLALIGIFFSMSSQPVTASAKTFQKIVDAAGKENTFEFKVLSSEMHGSHQVIIAADNGRFGIRTDDGGLVQIDAQRMQVYNPKDNTVLEINLAGVVDPKQVAGQMQSELRKGLKEMDLQKMLDDFAKQYGKENIRVGPIENNFGKSVFDVDLQKPGNPERVHMRVNAETNLPENILVSRQDSRGNWSDETRIELTFGQGVDIDLANVPFPAGAKHVQLDIGTMMQGGLKGLQDLEHLDHMKLGGDDEGHGHFDGSLKIER